MDDATLVGQALAGETQAVGALYDRYADRLFDYARRLTGNASDAADAVQDSFVIAMQRLGQLRDHTRLRPWLYAIVRSEVHRRHLRVDRLQFGVWDDPMSEPVSTDLAPSSAAEIIELQQLIAEAADGLSDEDREVLDLHLRHGLSGPDMAAALDIPERHVSVTMQRVRERLARGMGVVLVSRSPSCETFADLRTREGSDLTELARKRLARHIDGCEVCSADREERMRPEVLLGVLPMALAPLALRATAVNGAVGALGTAATSTLPAVEVGRQWMANGFPHLPVAKRALRTWLATGVAVATAVTGGTFLVMRTERTDSSPATLAPATTVSETATSVAEPSGTTTTTTLDATATTLEAVVTSLGSAPLTETPPTDPIAATVPDTVAAPPTTAAPDTVAPNVQSAAVAHPRFSSRAPAGFGTCDELISTTFSAVITDAFGTTSATAAWSAPGGATRTTALTRSGNTWSGIVGPFPYDEIPEGDLVKYDVIVTARDAAGNITVTPFNEVGAVESCPIVL